MWTTSSFRGNGAVLLLVAPLLAGCPGPQEDGPAPDAPRDAVAAPPAAEQAVTGYAQEPVELRSVSARRVEGDTALVRLAGDAFLEGATDPIAIDVRTALPLGELARTAFPAVYLNGERIDETRVGGADRLVGFLPDRSRIQNENRIAVAWVGSERATMTRAPLTLRADEIQ